MSVNTYSERRFRWHVQRGLTLVELMVSIVLGLLIVLVATGMLLTSKSSYTSQDQESIVSDTGRYAIENISRSLRQTAFVNWDTESSGGKSILETAIVSTPEMSANHMGWDNATVSNYKNGLNAVSPDGINGSDILAVRFFGVGNSATGNIGTDGFGSIVDCAGFGVPAPANQTVADASRGWSVYYVANDADGVPELRCMYRSGAAWAVVAFARGVESFQVLYGVDTDGDRIPNQYMTATQVNKLDDDLVYVETDPDLLAEEKNRKTHWKKIEAVRLALLVRGEQNVQGGAAAMTYNLFGQAYSVANGESDVGTKMEVGALDDDVQNRIRQVFQATVQYRNPIEGSGG